MQRKPLQVTSLLPRALKRLTEEEREQVTIRFKPTIFSLLKKAEQENVSLTVIYREEKHFFISSLIQVTEEEIVIDAPSAVIEPKLTFQDTLHVMGYVENVPFYFIVLYFKKIDHEQFPALQFVLPEAVIRLQRRTTFRLIIPLDFAFKGTLLLDNRKIEGRIADISTGGVRVTDLPLEWVKGLGVDQVLELIFELNGLRFKLPMFIIHGHIVKQAQGKKVGELSLRFNDCPKYVENQIAKFLLKHEIMFHKANRKP